MSMKTNTIYIVLFALLIGIVTGGLGITLFNGLSEQTKITTESTEKTPLYWVAPMDANYRRDQPGLSPMGMDLIPVYEAGAGNDEHGPGVVNISANVVNNLGVRTQKVAIKAMENIISTVGYVQYATDTHQHIHPRVSGWIEKLYIRSSGEKVNKGQALYRLYSPELVNAQEEFIMALKRQHNPLITAAKTRLQALQLPEILITELIKTKTVQQNVTFYAPSFGIIEHLNIHEGTFVQPSNALMSLVKLDPIWVEVDIAEREAGRIKPGLVVNMTLGYLPGKTWIGTIDHIYPTLNKNTRTLRVRLIFNNLDERLKPNMFAEVTLFTQADKPSLLVAKEAVIRTGNQNRVVLKLGEGQFKSIAVTIGHVGQTQIEILEGLQANDVVVTSAQFLLDSESSKASDFKRMAHNEPPEFIWTAGTINQINQENHSVNISHEPIPAWDWPEMTMDFSLAESINLQQLTVNDYLEINIHKTPQDRYKISAIRTAKNIPQATVNGVIKKINQQQRQLTIHREAIEQWDRAAQTVTFSVAKEIDLETLTIEMAVRFTFEVRNELTITQITQQSAAEDKL